MAHILEFPTDRKPSDYLSFDFMLALNVIARARLYDTADDKLDFIQRLIDDDVVTHAEGCALWLKISAELL